MKPFVKSGKIFLADHKAPVVLFKRVLYLTLLGLEQRTNLIYNIFLQVQVNYVKGLSISMYNTLVVLHIDSVS
jgi:hypothetical protein